MASRLLENRPCIGEPRLFGTEIREARSSLCFEPGTSHSWQSSASPLPISEKDSSRTPLRHHRDWHIPVSSSREKAMCLQTRVPPHLLRGGMKFSGYCDGGEPLGLLKNMPSDSTHSDHIPRLWHPWTPWLAPAARISAVPPRLAARTRSSGRLRVCLATSNYTVFQQRRCGGDGMRPWAVPSAQSK